MPSVRKTLRGLSFISLPRLGHETQGRRQTYRFKPKRTRDGGTMNDFKYKFDSDSQSYAWGQKRWRVSRLIYLSHELEPFDIPLKHLCVYNQYPDIRSFFDYIQEIDRTLKADLEYPIILDHEGYIMDGRHRLAKAFLEGHETIKAVRFDETPPPCYEVTE